MDGTDIDTLLAKNEHESDIWDETMRKKTKFAKIYGVVAAIAAVMITWVAAYLFRIDNGIVLAGIMMSSFSIIFGSLGIYMYLNGEAGWVAIREKVGNWL